MIGRREFIARAFVLAALVVLPWSTAQPAAKVPRVGVLHATSAASYLPLAEALRQGLRELGYVEGQNLSLNFLGAEDRYERLPALAAELVRLKVDVILASSGVAARS